MRSSNAWAGRAGGIGAWLLALSLSISAQGTERFDPARDLEGYGECSNSQYADLYELEPFRARTGQSLDAGELDRVREAWRAERVRVLREIERIETDPAAAGAYRFRRELAHRPYLSQQRFEFVDEPAPFVFAVQRTLESDALDAPHVAGIFAPWLAALAASFDETLARPLRLERRAGSELVPVVVLASRGAYDDYLRVVWKIANRGELARYEPQPRMLVLHQDRAGVDPLGPEHRLHEGLRELARLLLDDYAPAGRAPRPLWLEQGLADWLARNDGRSVESLRADRPSGTLVRPLVDLWRDGAALRAWWTPLARLVRLESFDDAVAEASARTNTQGLSPFGASWVARSECAALVRTSMKSDGARRDAFVAALGSALRGEAPDPFAALLAPEALPALERELVSDLWADQRALFPGAAASEAELESALRTLGLGGGAAPAAAVPTAGATVPALAALTHALRDDDAKLALAIARARAGDVEGASSTLEALASGSSGERAARELARVRAWTALRDRFLAHLAKSGAEISIRYDGAELRARVAAFEDGVVRFQQNRRRVQSLAASAIDPLELAKEMGLSKLGFDADGARAYPYVLNDFGTWKSLLGDSETDRSLRADAESDYPARRAAIDAAARLDALAGGPPLDDAPRAKAFLAELGPFWSEARELEFVAALRPELAALARAALALEFRAAGLPKFLHAKLSELHDGVLRLEYDFGSAEQLADFPAIDAKSALAGHGPPETDTEASVEVRDGRLAMVGACARRHALEFEGPMRLAFRYRDEHGGPPDGTSFFVAGLCSGAAGYLACMNGFWIEGLDKADAVFQRAPEQPVQNYFLDTDYGLELVHDGASSATLSRDGASLGTIPVGSLRSGGVLLWVCSDRVLAFGDLVIEGRPTAASIEAACGDWVEARIAELGLGDER